MTSTANESLDYQLLNPGLVDHIASAVAGIEPLRQAVMFDVPTTALLYFTKGFMHICVYSWIPVKTNVRPDGC